MIQWLMGFKRSQNDKKWDLTDEHGNLMGFN
jgi:hypothetical protein